MTIDKILQKQEGLTLWELILGIGSLGALALGVYVAHSGIKALSKYANEPVVERANIIIGPKAELFIERNGKRFYAEIDGKPVTEYLRRGNN